MTHQDLIVSCPDPPPTPSRGGNRSNAERLFLPSEGVRERNVIDLAYIISLFFVFCSLNPASAQNRPCYKIMVAEGQASYDKLDFEMAIKKYKAARICHDRPTNNEIDDLLKKARNGYIDNIKKSQRAAKLAEEKAKQSAESALREKEKAEASARRSEAGKLAFQAREATEKKHKMHALCLALTAHKMVEGNPLPLVNRAFGDATFLYSHNRSEKLSSGIQQIAFSPEGDRILCITLDQKIIVLDNSDTTDSLKILFSTPAFDQPISTAVFSPDGQEIMVAAGSVIKLFNNKGKPQHDFTQSDKFYESAQYSHDGNSILVCSSHHDAERWDKAGHLQTKFTGHQAKVKQAIFSPDDNLVLTLAKDKTARIWKTDGSQVAVLDESKAHLTDAKFSQDGKKIVTTCVDGTIRIYDTAGKLLNTLSGHGDIVRTANFSPSGKYIASCAADKTAILWDSEGSEILSMTQHAGDIRSIHFSPDEKYILTCSMDRTAKLWNLQGEHIMNIDHQKHPVNGAIFSPDSNKILTFSEQHAYAHICYTPQFMHQYIMKSNLDTFCRNEMQKSINIE